MGCDYYITKNLRIYYNNNDYLNIELSSEKGYYYFQYDEDELDYEKKENDYIEETLKPHMEPIIIYNNDKFNKPTFETKYKYIVENEINKYGKLWCEIAKIIKVEERYERD